jgi:hypothetical protein
MFDFATIERRFSGGRVFPGVPRAWHWSAAAGRFNFVMAVMSDGRHAVQMNTREMFDEDLARAVLSDALAHERQILSSKSLAILTDFNCQPFAFDCLIALAPAIHDAHKAKDPALHEVTYQVFAAYRCEFSGRETAKELVLRNKMVDSANIRRQPQPEVRLRYENTKTQGRTLGKGRGIDTPSALFAEIKKLVNAPGSFIEVENYLGEVAAVTWDRTYLLWKGDVSTSMSPAQVNAWVQVFILYGEARANAA